MRTLIIAIVSLTLVGCSGSLEKPQELPSEAVAKVTGKLKPGPNNSLINADPLFNPWLDLYNGSDWNVTDVDITVTRKKEQIARRFRYSISESEVKRNDKGDIVDRQTKRSFIKPYATDTMDGAMGDFLSGVQSPDEWSWSIVAVFGFKS